MSLFDNDENPLEESEDQLIHKHIPISQLIIKPSKLHKSDYPFENNLIGYMQQTGNNFLPVIVTKSLKNPDCYEVILNSHILNVARKAKLDYVWCLIANNLIKQQIEIESQTNLTIHLGWVKKEALVEALNYINKIESRTNIDVEKAAQLIIEKRDLGKLDSLNFLKDGKCRIGDKTLPKIEKYFVL